MPTAIYIFAGLTDILLLVIPDAFIAECRNDLYVAHMRIGVFYIF
jgi:hypothetical protein